VDMGKMNQLLESMGTAWRILRLDGTTHNTAAADKTPELEEVQTEAPDRQTSHGSELSFPWEERGRNVRMNFVQRPLSRWTQRAMDSHDGAQAFGDEVD